MRNIQILKNSGLAVAFLAALAPFARADTSIDIEKNRVIPVRLNDDISIRHSRRGDRFSATVENDYDLPRGTRLQGHVVSVHKKSDLQPEYIELTFDRMNLPDGSIEDIRAVPISLDSNAVRRDRNGRYYGTDKVIDRDKAVLGGALAGIVLGSIVHKPIEGAIIGAVAGVIIGQNQDSYGDNSVMRRGTRVGALFQRAFRVDYTGGRYGNDRYGNDRYGNDRYGDDRDRNDRYDNDRDEDDGYYRGSNRDRYDQTSSDPYGWNDRLSRNDRIVYLGRELRFTGAARPFWQGKTLLVPLYRAADQLDLRVDSRGRDSYIVTDADSTLRIEQGSRDYRLNGRNDTMAVKVTDRDGVIYLPIEILAQLKRDPVYLNGRRLR